MRTLISTGGVDPTNRSVHWHQAIAQAYFPLDLHFKEPERFGGRLEEWTLGGVSLSRLRSEALSYHRLPRHLACDEQEHLLITIPMRAEVYFAQSGREVHCRPGGYIIERSHEPYEFSYAERADLWVMKVEAGALGGRIRAPDRFCGMQFNAAGGISGLFVDMLHHIPERFDAMNVEAREAVGLQLVDLLALSIHSDERTLTSGTSSVRAAHLSRVEHFVRANLSRRELDPDLIARCCGISVRYLHELFRDTDRTLGQWIRDMRIEAVKEDLRAPGTRLSVAEICFRRGFGDVAHFSRLFKQQVGCSPGEYRRQKALI
ncbi:helix-turn-helix domain-containing protein [Nitratireductor sp. ZSWI3]|uniref:AraC-like ligand-binding domain-containing protein n=1 Tax=Nitratireductor sp. ZSWI3 TaxID=2966359 RepID=UPI002150593E|nr:helix-turn-helix domain-containing protein [Nitratireductor sp. ZSWI3]MCR4264545.1 helix-turn-helix domain-containing protein [Nitratireductor sp. ZSWI3]